MKISSWLAGGLVALAVSAPSFVRAQGMGGPDEPKADEPKADAPKADAPKADAPKADAPKADAPKADAPKAGKKTLGFDKPESWKAQGKPRGAMRGIYRLDGGEKTEDGVIVQVIAVGEKNDFDKELEGWLKQVEDKDGKKLEKSAVKLDNFEVNGIKVKTAELSGTFTVRAPKGKKGDKSSDPPTPEKKAGMKAIAAHLEGGPDGYFVVKVIGPEAGVDKVREDFMKFVKSVHVTDKVEDEPRKTKN